MSGDNHTWVPPMWIIIILCIIIFWVIVTRVTWNIVTRLLLAL
jgi:hypothetical protein